MECKKKLRAAQFKADAVIQTYNLKNKRDEKRFLDANPKEKLKV